MNNKLESRLAEIEKSRPIKNDGELLGVLLVIMENERAKRVGARDFELLEEAVDAVVALRGNDSDEVSSAAAAVAERAIGAIPEEEEYSYVRVRWLVPVAVIIAASLAVAVAARVFDLPFFSRDAREQVAQALPGMTDGAAYERDGWEISVGEIMSKVYTLEELDDLIARDGLLLPYGSEIVDIEASDNGDGYRLLIRTESGNVDIKTERDWGDAAPTFVRTGRFDVVYSRYDNVWQGEFVWKNCMYCITSDTKDGLEKLIGSMEERTK